MRRTLIPLLATCIAALSTSTPAAEVETAFESLAASSAAIQDFAVQSRFDLAGWDARIRLDRVRYDLDYEPAPFDYLGIEESVERSTTAVSLSGVRRLENSLSLQGAVGYRQGFADYRSLWLSRYFHQHFSILEGVPGFELYSERSPRAASASAGLRWEYVPANAIAQLNLTRIQDNVSPGYEIDFEGVRRGQLVLATNIIDLSSENVLSRWARSRVSLRASKTTERSWRYAADAAVNVALSDSLTWKNTIGGATESPQFDAAYAETAFDWQLSQGFAVFANARAYRDSGEIENALLFTTAAPELSSRTIGIGFRIAGESWTGRVYVATTRSDYDSPDPRADFFQNLYRDRDWTLVQIAAGKRF